MSAVLEASADALGPLAGKIGVVLGIANTMLAKPMTFLGFADAAALVAGQD